MILNFLKERKSIIQILIVSIILAFGVRFIGQGISEILGFTKYQNVIFGLLFVILAFLFFATELHRNKNKKFTIRGFLLWDKSMNKMIKVPQYEFSEKISEYFDSAFIENKGLEKIWEKYNLDYTKTANDITSGTDLLMQACEYFTLSKLSWHLFFYFNPKKFKKSRLIEYKRDDIPQILLKNDFLDLFTKSKGKRAAFVDTFNGDENNDKRITHISTVSNGHLYENFILILPKKCQISKPDKTTLTIETRKFKLTIKNEITGFTSEVDENLIKYYIGYKEQSKFRKYSIDTRIEISFKFWSYFSNNGWSYFTWVDSFIETYMESYSENRLFKKINWDTLVNLITVSKNLNQK